jgi:hypothetical protein
MTASPGDFHKAVRAGLATLFDNARKELGPSASVSQLAASIVARVSEEARHRYEATKNPVHVWKALSSLTNLADHAAELDPSLRGVPYPGGIPIWIQRYLQQTAWNLSTLAAGFDFRKPEAYEPRWWYEIGDLGPERAGSLLGQALGFSRRGKAAIAEYQNDVLPELVADLIWTEELVGNPPRVAQHVEMLQDALGLADERDARRRIARVRNRRPNRGRVIPP